MELNEIKGAYYELFLLF